MYLPDHFRQTDSAAIAELIRSHPLGALVAQTSAGLVANHVPFEFEAHVGPHGTLRAHIARANPLWKTHAQGSEVLVIFQGADAYVSPSLYPSKQETGKVVPTWNYVVLHAYGTVRFVEDASWLHALVSRLTDQHESGRAEPWRVTDAPSDYIEKMLAAIVGLEIEITRIEAKWKVTQNKSARDRAGVAAGLRAAGEAGPSAMARLVDPRRDGD